MLRPTGPTAEAAMVGVAQLVEHWVVVPGVAGSIPVTHPNEQVARTIARPGHPHLPTRFEAHVPPVLTFPRSAGPQAQLAPLAQLAEQLALNQRVRGSSPWRRTLKAQVD